MKFDSLSQWRRSAFCIAMAERNRNHIILFSEMLDQNSTPYTKLLTKTWSFLEGELQSLDNLERFFNEFDQWQTELLKDQNSFGAEAAQQACQSLYSASYALLDETANDCDLVHLSNHQLFVEMAEIGQDSEELKARHSEFENDVFELLLSGKPKREIIKSIKKLSSMEPESSLGISLD